MTNKSKLENADIMKKLEAIKAKSRLDVKMMAIRLEEHLKKIAIPDS